MESDFDRAGEDARLVGLAEALSCGQEAPQALPAAPRQGPRLPVRRGVGAVQGRGQGWLWPTVSPRPSARPRGTLRRRWDEKGVLVSLWTEDEGGAADPLPVQNHGHLDAIGDPDERNAAVHPELFPVERHRALDLTRARAFPGDREQQRLGFGDAPDGEVALNLQGLRPGLHNPL